MKRVEESVEIRCPVDKVFTYTAEAKRWHEWQSIIKEAEQTSQEPLRVGTTFEGIARMMGRSMSWTAEATEYEKNRNWAKKIDSGGLSIVEHVTYDPIDRGTKFTIMYDIKVGGLLKLFSSMVVRTMRKETEKSLRDLKRILEAQA